MATVNQIKIVVEAEDKASAPIERATESTRRLGRATRDVTRESKKDWSGLGDLFGRVLPRNLQQLTRGFKGTQRQVGRLSKSFKVLKTAWASIGIGLVIIALEAIVENWDKISESLGLYNKEAEETEELNNKIASSTAEMARSAKAYADKIRYTSTTEEERKIAVEGLNRALGAGIDIEADRATQIEQSAALISANEKLIKSQTKSQEAENTAQEEGDRIRAKRWKDLGFFEKMSMGVSEFKAQQAAEIAVFDNEALKLKSLAITAEGELNEVITATNATIDKRKESVLEGEKTAREADAARKKGIAAAAADAKWLANQRITIAQETELRLIQDEEKRDLRSLEMQHEEAKAELEIRGGTLNDKLELEQKYLMDKAEIEATYREEEAITAQQVLDDQIALGDELYELSLDAQEREELAAQQLFDRRVALAGDDEGLIKQATQALVDDLDVINVDAAKKLREEDAKTQKLKMQASLMTVNAARNALGMLGDLAEEGSKEAKAMAIVDIMLAQAVSVANAIAGATTAATATGPGVLVATPLFIAQMVGTVLASFAGVKSVLNKAGATGGGVGSGGGGAARRGAMAQAPQVPLPARLDSPDNMQAYVVQSQLQGQMNAQVRLNGQIVL
tara:strand:- start:564 stop:2438 length:1875 start_codon:yes stop_codon:yes gene_type:complete